MFKQKSRKKMSLFIAFAIASSSVNAWGFQAHNVIGLIAQEFLTTEATAGIATFTEHYGKLGESKVPTGNDTFVTWADIIKKTKLKYTELYHFVDTHDEMFVNHDIKKLPAVVPHPLTECGYVDERDCKDNKCITGAVANYTMQAQCGSPVSEEDRRDAIRLAAHFVSDITQPLHTCGRLNGGNGNTLPNSTKFDDFGKVNFDGVNVTLHGVWDYSIPEKFVKLNFKNDFTAYSKFIVDSIKGGKYSADAKTWISKHGLNDLSEFNNSLAAIDWTYDSKHFDCASVWNAFDTNKTQDFGGQYYKDSYPVVELQIAKAGYRLADWLNKIYGTCTKGTTSSTTTTTLPSATSTSSVVSDVAASTYASATPTVVITSNIPYTTESPSRPSTGYKYDVVVPGNDYKAPVETPASAYNAAAPYEAESPIETKAAYAEPASGASTSFGITFIVFTFASLLL